MKECLNCASKNRDTDIYCRNCGCLMKGNGQYIFTNILITILAIGLVLLIALFITSYVVFK